MAKLDNEQRSFALSILKVIFTLGIPALIAGIQKLIKTAKEKKKQNSKK